jgi:multisubunit Na+/H+ antiporter MnhE subunit
MNTLVFVSAAVILALVVLAKLPGLEHLVRPIIDLVFTAIKAILENLISWSIWLFKMIWDSHLEIVKHLILSEKDIDPTFEIREKAE